MNSKTSLFNKSLFGLDMAHKALPMGVTVFICFLITLLLPGVIERGDGMEVLMSSRNALYWLSSPLLIAMFCIVVVLTQFTYMYRRRDSYMLHAMPVSRRAHFLTHAGSGLLMIVVLALVCYLCVMIFLSSELTTPGTILLCFCETVIEILFFYSLSLFVAVVCGNVVIAFITYGVLNALWLFINVFAAETQYLLVSHPIAVNYGSDNPFNFMLYEKSDVLFPVYYFMKRVNNGWALAQDSDGAISLMPNSVGDCAWMLIPAAVLFVLAYFLYQKKEIERTGEIVAFSWCKVVFRVLFTACGACLAAIIMYIPILKGLYIEKRSTSNLIMVSILLIVGGVLSFFISEMILRKTVHVFRGKRVPFLQGGIAVGVVIAYVVLTATGLFTKPLIPSASDVSRVDMQSSLTGGNYYSVSDPDQIEQVLDQQKDLVNDPELLELAKKRNDPNLTNDELLYYADMPNMVLEMMTGEDDYSINIESLVYYFPKESIGKMMDSILNLARNPAQMADVLIGSDAGGAYVDDMRFSMLRDTTGLRWNHEMFEDYEGITRLRDGDATEEPVLTKYDYTTDSTTSVVKHEEDDSNYELKKQNRYEIYEAVLADMKEGTILPYPTDSAKALGDPKADQCICDLGINVTTNEESRCVEIALTTQSAHTIEVLKRYNVLI